MDQEPKEMAPKLIPAQDLNTLINNFKAQFNDNMENRRRWGGGGTEFAGCLEGFG